MRIYDNDIYIMMMESDSSYDPSRVLIAKPEHLSHTPGTLLGANFIESQHGKSMIPCSKLKIISFFGPFSLLASSQSMYIYIYFFFVWGVLFDNSIAVFFADFFSYSLFRF